MPQFKGEVFKKTNPVIVIYTIVRTFSFKLVCMFELALKATIETSDSIKQYGLINFLEFLGLLIC